MLEFSLSLRRAALLGTALVATGVAVPPVQAQQTIVWNHNIFGPKREVTVGIEAAAEMFNKASKGALEIKIAYGAALGPEKQTPEAIKTGGYEGGQMCAGYYPNKFPLLSVMELPFLGPRETAKKAKLDRLVLNHPLVVKEMAERWNIKNFVSVPLPPYEFMGNKKIASAQDMKGVKMRIAGLNAKALQVFGAVPTMVTAPEGYTALERGTIDSFGFPYSYSFGAYRLYEVSKYSTEGLSMGGFMCFQGVSLTTWDKLPKNLQDMLEAARDASDKALLDAYEEADKKWVPIFKEKLEVVPFPPAEREKIAAGANQIWEDWVKEQEAAGRPGRQMLDFVKAEVAKLK
jgi:TRAP-type C4-dicarboxylate transport system substrate-binding protein